MIKYCKLKHVKGTKWKQNEIKHSDPPKRPTNSNVGMPEENVKGDKTVEKTNVIEVSRLLKAEILESMDIKLAMFMAQQQSYQKPQYQISTDLSAKPFPKTNLESEPAVKTNDNPTKLNDCTDSPRTS